MPEIKEISVSGYVNLAKLVHVHTAMQGRDGQPKAGVFIPFDANLLAKDDNGNIYVNFSGKHSDKSAHSTHWIKKSVKKEIFDKMTEDEKKAVPFLGNLTLKAHTFSDAPNATDSGINTAAGFVNPAAAPVATPQVAPHVPTVSTIEPPF